MLYVYPDKTILPLRRQNGEKMNNIFDITDFGACGDGKTDCTTAIQSALDEAAKCRGVVTVPPGNYLCNNIIMPRGVSLVGFHAWSYRNDGASVLTLCDDTADCLIDISSAVGCTIKGICLDGKGQGENIHGIKLWHDEYNGGGEEDTPTLEDCRIGHFSGDGVHLLHVWCFSVRHCMLHSNGGNGLFVDGWDGFVLDNWFSGNAKAGMAGGKILCSVTATGNRVEWNRLAGFLIRNGNTINITGNYIDRTGRAALDMRCTAPEQVETVTVTGNVFNRSGANEFGNEPPENILDRTHISLERCVNVVISGNTFRAGRNDGENNPGCLSPDYNAVIRSLRACVIMNNVWQCGAVKENVLDLGGHKDKIILDGNIGEPSPGGKRFAPAFDD